MHGLKVVPGDSRPVFDAHTRITIRGIRPPALAGSRTGREWSTEFSCQGESRADKLSRLRNAVRSGHYSPDPGAVARKLLDAGLI